MRQPAVFDIEYIPFLCSVIGYTALGVLQKVRNTVMNRRKHGIITNKQRRLIIYLDHILAEHFSVTYFTAAAMQLLAHKFNILL